MTSPESHSSGSRRLILPRLDCPYGTLMHPDSGGVEDDLLGWLGEHNLLTDVRWMDGIRYGRITEYTARLYPYASREGLRIVSYWYAWMFIFDDGICGRHGLARSPADIAAVHLWMGEIFDDPYGYDPGPRRREISENRPAGFAEFLHALQCATVDLWKRIADISTASQYCRLKEAMFHFLLATVWEAGRYSAGLTPSVNEYTIARRDNDGGDPACAFMDFIAGYEVPANDYCHIGLRRLRRLSHIILGFVNDIFSFAKETEADETCFSIVTVLMSKNGLGRQDALDEAGRLHNEAVARYVRVEEEIKGQEESPAVIRLVNEMGTYMRGNYDWHYTSPRYAASRYFDLRLALKPDDVTDGGDWTCSGSSASGVAPPSAPHRTW